MPEPDIHHPKHILALRQNVFCMKCNFLDIYSCYQHIRNDHKRLHQSVNTNNFEAKRSFIIELGSIMFLSVISRIKIIAKSLNSST